MRQRKTPYFDVLLAASRAKQPHFFAALVADTKFAAAAHGDRSEFRGRAGAVCQAVRLAWTTDAFLALAFYRAQARLEAPRRTRRADTPGGPAGRTRIVGTVLGSRRPTCDHEP